MLMIVLSLTMCVLGLSVNAQVSYSGFTQEHIEELSKLDLQIESIRTKWEYVKNSESENALAIQEGWYDDMRMNLWQLFSQKRTIIRAETGKEFFSIEEFAELSLEKQQVVIDENKSLIEQN